MVDIEVDDFVVRETGQLRDVLSVRVADYPLALVLDNGQGAGRDLEAIRRAAARFIGRVGRRPVAVALSDPPGLIATLDDERAIVMQRLEKATVTSSSEGLFQAIVAAARALQETGSPFSAIIVVSAAPVSSVPAEVLMPILESGASVHVVVHREASAAPGETPGNRPRLCARCRTKPMDSSRRSMRRPRIRSRSIGFRTGSRRNCWSITSCRSAHRMATMSAWASGSRARESTREE